MAFPQQIVGIDGFPLSQAGAAAIVSGGLPPLPPVLPATIAGDKIFLHMRSTDLGAVDPSGPSPVWLNGLDNFGAQINVFNAGAPPHPTIIDDVIDGFPAIRVPSAVQRVFAFFCGLAAEGDRFSVFAVMRINDASSGNNSDTERVLGIGVAVINDTACIAVGNPGAHYADAHQLICSLGIVGGTSPQRAVAVEVPMTRFDLFGFHYDSDVGRFEIGGVGYTVPTGGAGCSADTATGPNGIQPYAGSDEQVDVVDWVVAIGLTTGEKDAIRSTYFARRYPSLRLS